MSASLSAHLLTSEQLGQQIFPPRPQASTTITTSTTYQKNRKAMATFCNYTHYELQNTSGLERQGHGLLFPYNPEFYDRASGLYGPGTIIAWNMLFVSLVINAVFKERPDKTPDRPNFWSGMSAELVTFVAYPVFAATDLLVHGIQLFGHENRASALLCLRDPNENTHKQSARNTEYRQHPLDLANIPPDILSLGQRVVELTGPLDVTYSSFPLAFWTVVALETRVHAQARKRAAATMFVGASMAYVLLLVFIFHCTLGSFSDGVFFISFTETMRLSFKISAVMIVMGDLIVAGVAMLFLATYCPWIASLWLRDDWEKPPAFVPKDIFSPAGLGAVVLGLMLWTLNDKWLVGMAPNSPWVPDLGVALSEQDQLAALIAASFSLCYTLYSVVGRRLRRGTEVGETVELQESLLPERDSQDEEALVGSRRVSTM